MPARDDRRVGDVAHGGEHLLAHLVAALGDAGPNGSKDLLGPTPGGFAQPPNRAGDDAGDRSAPSGVHGADPTRSGQQHGHAVGDPHGGQNSGTGHQDGVPFTQGATLVRLKNLGAVNLRGSGDGGHPRGSADGLPVIAQDAGRESMDQAVSARKQAASQHRRTVAATLLAMLLALLACTDGSGPLGRGNVADYDVSLLVRYPKNQSPLEGVDTLELVLDHAEGDPEVFELSSVDNPQIDGLGDLEDTRVILRGYSGGVLVAYGSTTPLTAHDEELDQTLLVAEVDQMAWLESSGSGRGFGALANDGRGSFYLFGGESENPGSFGQGWSSETHDSIWRLDVAPPDTLKFEAIGTTMPSFVGSADGTTYTGRAGHTATLLTGNASDSGLILVTGGAAETTNWESASYDAFLFDPVTEEVVTLGNDPLRAARYQHLAVEHVSGDVFLMGGWTRASAPQIGLSNGWEIYRRDSRTFENGTGELAGGPYAAAASVGSAGVLHCGGIEIRSSFESRAGCSLLQPSGTLTALSSPNDLEFSHHAMASLGSGKVLMSGGVRAVIEQYEETDAIDEAWIFDAANNSWTRAGDLNIARANHAMVPLPDGRVLVVGGATRVHLQSAGDETALACAEIFDPTKGANGEFEVLAGCTANSSSSTLPAQVFWPMVSVDDDYGVLVAGGFDIGEDADPNVSLWLPEPVE